MVKLREKKSQFLPQDFNLNHTIAALSYYKKYQFDFALGKRVII